MADNSDVLLRFIEEQWTQGRQSEEQRATITNFVITISAATFGFLVQQGFTLKSLPLAILLIVLGIYGATISAKLYERWHFHMRRARYWRKRIVELHPDTQLEQLKSESDKEHKKLYPKMEKIQLNRLWVTLHILIALIGVICATVIIISQK